MKQVYLNIFSGSAVFPTEVTSLHFIKIGLCVVKSVYSCREPATGI